MILRMKLFEVILFHSDRYLLSNQEETELVRIGSASAGASVTVRSASASIACTKGLLVIVMVPVVSSSFGSILRDSLLWWYRVARTARLSNAL